MVQFMANNEFAGLQILPSVISSGATNSLAANTAVIIDASYRSITKGFLLRQWRVLGVVDDFDELDQLIIFLARGGATVAEIALAFTQEVISPEDASSAGQMSAKARVIWDTIVGLPPPGSSWTIAGGSQAFSFDTGWKTIGGKKGIPFSEQFGPELFAFNYGGAALAAGLDIGCILLMRGVWLHE